MNILFLTELDLSRSMPKLVNFLTTSDTVLNEISSSIAVLPMSMIGWRCRKSETTLIKFNPLFQ